MASLTSGYNHLASSAECLHGGAFQSAGPGSCSNWASHRWPHQHSVPCPGDSSSLVGSATHSAQGHHRSGDKEGHRGCTLPLPWHCSWSLGMAEPGRPPPGPEVPHKNPPGPGVTAGHRLGSGSAGLLHSSDYSQTRGSKDSSPLLDYILAGGTALPQPQGLGRGLWGQPLWSAEPN